MATLSIPDAQEKYAEQLAAIKSFEQKVKGLDFTINKDDVFELGEDWSILNNNKPVGSFSWNVPNYITLVLGDGTEFDHDYLGNMKNWEWALLECEKALKSAK